MPFWREAGISGAARTLPAANRDRRRRGACSRAADSGERNDDRTRRRRIRGAPDAGARPSAAGPRRRRRSQPLSPFAPLDLISKDELESIHQAALEVLKEIGIDFLHDEARAMLKSAGADVDPASRRVRFDPALVEAHIGLAPKEFVLHARNPARNLVDRRASRRFRLGGQRAQFVRPRGRPAAGQPGATIKTSSVSARASIRSISGAAIRSSRSTFTPPSATSTRCSTC